MQLYCQNMRLAGVSHNWRSQLCSFIYFYPLKIKIFPRIQVGRCCSPVRAELSLALKCICTAHRFYFSSFSIKGAVYTFYLIYSTVGVSNSWRRDQNIGFYPFALSSVDMFLDYCDFYVSSRSCFSVTRVRFRMRFQLLTSSMVVAHDHVGFGLSHLNLLIWLKTRFFGFSLAFLLGKFKLFQLSKRKNSRISWWQTEEVGPSLSVTPAWSSVQPIQNNSSPHLLITVELKQDLISPCSPKQAFYSSLFSFGIWILSLYI